MDKKVLIKAITILQESIFEIMDFDDDKNGEDLHKLLELLKMLLKIPKRTIETLKIGDYIFLQMTQGLVVAVDDYEFEIVTSLGSHENISYHPSLKYKIIPHEFLEICGEINDKN